MLARLLAAATVLTALATPMAARAATGAIAVTDVNLRAGPSTGYPAVDVVGAGERVRVFGCLSDRSWCDVSFRGIRGWMSSNYLAYATGSQRYTGTRVVEVISAPVISFSIGGYWDDHYRSRPFYRERARYDYRDGPRRDRDWDRPPPPRRSDWDRDRDRDRYERERDRAERDRDRADRERDRHDRRDRRDNDRFDPRDGRDFGDRRDRGDRGPRERNEYERAYRVEQPRPIYRVD